MYDCMLWSCVSSSSSHRALLILVLISAFCPRMVVAFESLSLMFFGVDGSSCSSCMANRICARTSILF